MYCFKCENEITVGTVCGNCGYDNKGNADVLFPTRAIIKNTVKLMNRNDDQFVIKDSVLVKYKGKWSVPVIPYGVFKIGDRAFSGSKNVTGVVIPDSVTEIDDYAFWGCSLEKLSLPPYLKRIGKYAFAWCTGLCDLNIPDSVSEVEDFAFARCRKLSSVSMSMATVCGEGVFASCDNLSYTNIIKRKPAPQTEPVFSDSTKEFLAKVGYQNVVNTINNVKNQKQQKSAEKYEAQIKRLEAKIKELEKEIERAEKVIGEYKARDKKLKELMGE